MKISEYIASLETIKAEHGDLEIDCYNPYRGRMEARDPVIQYRRILKPRERRDEFWNTWDGGDRKGDKVVRV